MCGRHHLLTDTHSFVFCMGEGPIRDCACACVSVISLSIYFSCLAGDTEGSDPGQNPGQKLSPLHSFIK